ncbi:MAG: family 43 glycosylhydrolase [Alkalibacterium sp.]|nr:family 43 glycosylhydrolase [Alkalibacterium sp.]
MKKVFGNPILPADEYIPDPEAHVFGDRVYIYGSHDQFNGKIYCENDYVTWSASVTDLTDWRYEGIIYRKEQHDSPIKKGKPYMYAPDVAEGPDGRYYLYYSMADSSVMSVAVSQSPAGPFEYYGDVRNAFGHTFGESLDDYFEFDPAILVADDKIYLYSGSGQKSNEKNGHPVAGLFVRELEADMLTAKTEPKILMPADDDRFAPNFFEGASIRQFDDWFVLVYMSTDLSGLHYAMSRFPDREFMYKGRLHSTSHTLMTESISTDGDRAIENNHGSLEKINDQYVVFNHRHTNQSHFSRQVVADYVERNSDGSFKETDYTSQGLRGKPFDESGVYEAGMACKLVNTLEPSLPPYVTQYYDDSTVSVVRSITNGSVVEYKYFQFDQSVKVTLGVNGEARGELLITQMGDQTTECMIPIDVYTEEWLDLSCLLEEQSTPYTLGFEYKGKGSLSLKALKIDKE